MPSFNLSEPGSRRGRTLSHPAERLEGPPTGGTRPAAARRRRPAVRQVWAGRNLLLLRPHGPALGEAAASRKARLDLGISRSLGQPANPPVERARAAKRRGAVALPEPAPPLLPPEQNCRCAAKWRGPAARLCRHLR